MSLITVSSLGKGFGPQTVFENVSVRVARGEKIGIVGKNGGGKTTFLKLLIGRETPDKGTVSVAKRVRVGYLSQIAELDDAKTVRQEAESSLVALFDIEAELRETEAAMAASPDDPDAMEAYQAARDRWDFAGGGEAESSLAASMTALGFAPGDWEKPVSVLSGGEKTRLAMAKLLASAPDVLVLDEPTNHLDIAAVEWLEGFLNRFPRRGACCFARPKASAKCRANDLGGGKPKYYGLQRRIRRLQNAARSKPRPSNRGI